MLTRFPYQNMQRAITQVKFYRISPKVIQIIYISSSNSISTGGLNSKYDIIQECENDVKLPYVLFGGEKKTKGKQTDFQRVPSENRM